MIFWYWLQSTFAGAWSYIWHWGAGVAAIIILVAAAIFSTSIPIIGPYLTRFRDELLWLAFCIAVLLAGMWVGSHDEAKRCDKKAVVIEKIVKQVVKGTTTPRATKQKDKWDDPNN